MVKSRAMGPVPALATSPTVRSFASSATLLILSLSVCHGLVTTCEQLQKAFDDTKTQDVVVTMVPLETIDCVTATTMSMNSNILTVKSTEDPDDFRGFSELNNIRFEVTNGARLIWETNVQFNGASRQDLDGGALFVGEGSSVRFLNDMRMSDAGVASVTDESSDFSSFPRNGGCVFTNGDFIVDGDATFTNCGVDGSGESAPGNGGALYVGTQGSALFKGEVDIMDVDIADDGGGDGAGIYNEGKVSIKGNAKFEAIRGANGAAIFNAAGAQFRFTNQATAVFRDCTTPDGLGTALYNGGKFKFSGPALFLETEAPTILVSGTGETVLSENTVFFDNDSRFSAAVLVLSGGEIDIPSSVSFIDDVESDCSTVYYRGTKTCLD